MQPFVSRASRSLSALTMQSACQTTDPCESTFPSFLRQFLAIWCRKSQFCAVAESFVDVDAVRLKEAYCRFVDTGVTKCRTANSILEILLTGLPNSKGFPE